MITKDTTNEREDAVATGEGAGIEHLSDEWAALVYLKSEIMLNESFKFGDGNSILAIQRAHQRAQNYKYYKEN